MRARVFLGFLTALAPFLAAGGAAAQPSGAVPLDRLLPQIRRSVPGQFLDAEGATTGGSPHYHLKWLTPDGRVMWLDADARTGRVVSQSPGRDSFDAPRVRPPDGESGGPPDRREEGRSTSQRYDRQDDPRADARRPYRGDPGGGDDRPQRPNFSRPDTGDRGQGFGGRFERGGDRNFSGGPDGRFGGRPDFGNRGTNGGGFGGRDRRGGGR